MPAVALPLAAFEIVNPKKLFADKSDTSKVRYVFLIDTYKCVGCGMCVKACKLENEIPYDANVTRTWVERYVMTKDGKTFADTPKGARDGFITSKIDLGDGKIPGHQEGRYRKGLLCAQALQPVRKSSLRSGLPCRRNLSGA